MVLIRAEYTIFDKSRRRGYTSEVLVLLAAAFLPCVAKLPDGRFKEPPTLSKLLDCQQAKLLKVAAVDQEEFQDKQREEVRLYLERHPDRASVDVVEPENQETPEEATKAKAEAAGLEKSLWDKSEGGKKGVTPEMAKQALEYIKGKQKGEVSPEMLDLLSSLTKDGEKLSDESMGKLRDAALKAKKSGMNLGLEPEMEEAILQGPPPKSPGSL